MNGIPWAEIGVGGAVAAVVLVVVFAFILKWKDGKEEGHPCINDPDVKKALLDNQLMGLNITRMESHLGEVRDNAIKQTEISKQMLTTLKEIAKNGKKG